MRDETIEVEGIQLLFTHKRFWVVNWRDGRGTVLDSSKAVECAENNTRCISIVNKIKHKII